MPGSYTPGRIWAATIGGAEDRSTGPRRGGLAGGAVAAVLVIVLAACGASHPSASVSIPPPTQSTPAPAAPASSAPPAPPPSTAPPTTRWLPSSAQASPDAAAARLVNAWAAGDRATAATVAAPGAVAALFAVPYPGPHRAIGRGCSGGFPPIVCTYGPPGGAAPSESVYEVSLAHVPAGWYVTSVRILS